MEWLRKAGFAVVLTGVLVWGGSARGGGMQTVLFDQGHGQRFVVGDTGELQFSKLATVFAENGSPLATTDVEISDNTLAGATALVLTGPFRPYTPGEVEAIARFVDRGGRVAIMLHIGAPLASILDRFGVAYSTRPIHERQQTIAGESLNFRVTRLEPHPLTKGLERFSLYGGWALMSRGENGTIIARTSPDAWVDLNGDGVPSPGDAVQSFGVVVEGSYGKGRFVVFGDDAIFQNRFLDDDNRRLALNLIGWLKEARPEDRSPGHTSGTQRVVKYDGWSSEREAAITR